MGEKRSRQLSTPQSDCPMVEVCDICGDVGIANEISICPKCKTNREHSYCRKFYPNNRTNDWCCDECEGKQTGSSKNLNGDVCKKLVSNPSGWLYEKHAPSSANGRYRRGERMVTKGKVKCIPSHEAIMLSSGCKRGDTSIETTKHINLSSSRTTGSMCTSSSSYRKGSSLKSPMTSTCNRPTNSVIQRHASRTVHVLKVFVSETKAVQAKRKELIQMAESVANMVPAETQDTASFVKETSIRIETPSAPAAESQFLQPITSGHKVSGDLFPMMYDLEKCKPTDTERQTENYSRVPARYSSWKGRFEIQGDNLHYISSGYVAIPRARCFRGVLECSKSMPELLQFKLVPRKEIWRVFFQDDNPGEDDIGLYFCSGGNKRSPDIDFLTKFIEAQDVAMRCDLGEVRLCLFTSKLLPADYRKLCNEYYFWGVFQKIKKDQHLYQQ